MLLGVLYESYVHPLTILAGLPSAAVGALATLMIFGQDLTLIATIGILLLIGIVKKNAIMMIDFALDAQRHRGATAPEAIREAGRHDAVVPEQLRGSRETHAITLYITPVIYIMLDRFSGKGPVTLAEVAA